MTGKGHKRRRAAVRNAERNAAVIAAVECPVCKVDKGVPCPAYRPGPDGSIVERHAPHSQRFGYAKAKAKKAAQ